MKHAKKTAAVLAEAILLAVVIYALKVDFFVWYRDPPVFTSSEKEALEDLSRKYDVTRIASLTENEVLGERKEPPWHASVLFSGQELKLPPEKQDQVILETIDGEIMLLTTAAPEKTAEMIADYRRLPFLKAVEMDESGSLFTEEQGMVTADVPAFRSAPVASASSPPVTVAVLDSGLDTAHPAFPKGENLWKNTIEEKGKRGVDDDRNGFVDDISGWNFVEDTPAISDDNGHGTHIAGVIAAKPTPLSTMSGVNPEGAKLMILKVAGSNGSLRLSDVISALHYVERQQVAAVNMSFGFEKGSEIFSNTLQKLDKKGVFLVAAAGNKKSNTKFYPAAYSQVFSVGATKPEGGIWPTSNFGNWVKAAVPGKIFSTLPAEQYGIKTGTSQAAALVTGLYSYYKTHTPEKSAADITQEIQNYSAQFESTLSTPKFASAGERWEEVAVSFLSARRAPTPTEVKDFELKKHVTVAEAEKLIGAFSKKRSDLDPVFQSINAARIPATVSPDLLLSTEYTPAALLKKGEALSMLFKVRKILHPEYPPVVLPEGQLTDKTVITRQDFVLFALQIL